jgi:hypothetical protein
VPDNRIRDLNYLAILAGLSLGCQPGARCFRGAFKFRRIRPFVAEGARNIGAHYPQVISTAATITTRLTAMNTPAAVALLIPGLPAAMRQVIDRVDEH